VVIEIFSFRFALASYSKLFLIDSFHFLINSFLFCQFRGFKIRRSDAASSMHSAACLKLTDFDILRVGGKRSTPGILPSAPVSVNSEGAPPVAATPCGGARDVATSAATARRRPGYCDKTKLALSMNGCENDEALTIPNPKKIKHVQFSNS